MLLGIDVGGTSVKYATCDEKGHLFDKGSFKTPDTLEDMYQLLEGSKVSFMVRLRSTIFMVLI